MAQQRQSRPFSIHLLETALFLQGISVVAGGLGLMMDPSGDALRIPDEASPRGDTGKVGHPQAVRSLDGELSFAQIERAFFLFTRANTALLALDP